MTSNPEPRSVLARDEALGNPKTQAFEVSEEQDEVALQDRLRSNQVRRVSLGKGGRRLSYERRIRFWLAGLTLPCVVLVGLLTWTHSGSWAFGLAAALGIGLAFAVAAAYFYEQLIRPLQTLANVVAALREDDYSFRARGALRGDSLGDLALEINTLASVLQSQRSAARDALTLVERVMTSMQSPVVAFDNTRHLRLLNPAAEAAFTLERGAALGLPAESAGLGDLLDTFDQGLYSGAQNEGRPLAFPVHSAARYSVRRTTFRLHGVPHTLFVLTDVAAALREEERVAWQRLIRVLSHEINNSLTPIKSLAGSLRTRLPALAEMTPPGTVADLHRGLYVIEERAASLNRFLQAYQQLTRLPAPKFRKIAVSTLLGQVLHLEVRLPILLEAGPEIELLGDPDQLQQLLINLLRNAVEAAMSEGFRNPAVTVAWSVVATYVSIYIRDNGPGIGNAANLFVPFYTTKPEGSGIGLVLAQQIASAHRGTITLGNNPDARGCVAELRLPLEQG